jgi:hypothetical protein
MRNSCSFLVFYFNNAADWKRHFFSNTFSTSSHRIYDGSHDSSPMRTDTVDDRITGAVPMVPPATRQA